MKSPKIQVSLANVAKLAGCTAASVSLVLNDSPLPSARMRARVKQAASQLGYVPNRMAQSLKRGRTFTLGVVMPYCADSYVSAFLDAVSAEAAEFGFQLEIHFHRWSATEEDRALRSLGELRAEGIFFCGSRLDYRGIESVESLKKQRIPLVGIGPRINPLFEASLVVDRPSGAVELGAYLGGLGHQAVDYLEPVLGREAAESAQPHIGAVVNGISEGLGRVIGTPHVSFFKTSPDYLLARRDIEHHGLSAQTLNDITDRVIEDYLDSRSAASAVVTSSIVLAWKLMAALRRRGRRCPEDISIAGFCVEGTGAMGGIPLTAVEYSAEFMARKGVAAMLAAIAGRKVASVIKIPTSLVTRASCIAQAGGPRLVAH